MNAGLLNVLHDAGDEHVLRIAERVDIDFDGVLKEVIDEGLGAPANIRPPGAYSG